MTSNVYIINYSVHITYIPIHQPIYVTIIKYVVLIVDIISRHVCIPVYVRVYSIGTPYVCVLDKIHWTRSE